MFQALLEPLGREALTRVTLLLNHVIGAEPEATRRLLGHVDATVQIEWQRWPAFLPPPPQAIWRITPAGLLELAEPGFVGSDATQLVVGLDQQALTGWALCGALGRPPMAVQGDVGLAADISWLAEHLRWDVEDDLARVVGDAPARQIAQFGRAAVHAVHGLLQRVRPNPTSAA